MVVPAAVGVVVVVVLFYVGVAVAVGGDEERFGHRRHLAICILACFLALLLPTC